MSILKNKMIKEAVDPKEAQVDNSLWSIDVDIAFDDANGVQKLLRYATKRNVSIEVYTLKETGQDGAILVGPRAEVQRVYKKYWADGFDETLEQFKEDIKKYRPKVYHEYTIDIDIMKLSPKVCMELLTSGCIIRDYNDDAKTARILGPKTKVAELARLYFDKSDFDRDKIQKIKESVQETNRLRKFAGLQPLKESYDSYEEIEPKEVTFGDEVLTEMGGEFSDSGEATDFMVEISANIDKLISDLNDERLKDWLEATEENFDARIALRSFYAAVQKAEQLQTEYEKFFDAITDLG